MEKRFLRCIIRFPKGAPVLRLDGMDEYLRNEPDEVLLPPSEFEIVKIEEGNGDCIGVITMNMLQKSVAV